MGTPVLCGERGGVPYPVLGGRGGRGGREGMGTPVLSGGGKGRERCPCAVQGYTLSSPPPPSLVDKQTELSIFR